jgi:hypothetical protein
MMSVKNTETVWNRRSVSRHGGTTRGGSLSALRAGARNAGMGNAKELKSIEAVVGALNAAGVRYLIAGGLL